MSHTPGPWKVEQHPAEPDFYTIRTEPGNQYIALVDGLDMGTAKGGQLAANARLIAAAPMMLEVLEGMAHCDDPSTMILHYEDEILAILRAISGERRG